MRLNRIDTINAELDSITRRFEVICADSSKQNDTDDIKNLDLIRKEVAAFVTEFEASLKAIKEMPTEAATHVFKRA